MPLPAKLVVGVFLFVWALAACVEVDDPVSGPSHTHDTDVPVSSTASPTSPTSFPVGESGFYGVVRDPAVPAVPFTLTDQDGRMFRFPRDLDGEVALVYFGYTHCPDICPGTLAAIAVALRELPASVPPDVDVVFVTVDPERDTAEVVGEYVDLFSEDFVGLTGEEERVQEILASLGLPPATKYDLGEGEYGVGHPAGVLAFTSDRLAHLEYPFGVTAEMWTHDLEKLVVEGWGEA